MLADKIKPGGEVLFYSGSFAYDKAEAVGKELVQAAALRAGRRLQERCRIFRKRALADSGDVDLGHLQARAGDARRRARPDHRRSCCRASRSASCRSPSRCCWRASSMRWRAGRAPFRSSACGRVLGLFGIVAGVIVAVMADRLAHRRRLAALGQAFEHAIILPISYHAEKGSGAVVRTILAGTDALFWNWLSFLREQFVALVGILVLVPTAIYMNADDGADPGGARRHLRARQRVRGAQDQHRPGRRRAVSQQRLRPRRRRARQRHRGAELCALRLRDAGHAHHHGRAAGRAVSGADLVGPADRA